MQHFSPTEYLKIDIASNYGLDKLTWRERINWFDENLGEDLRNVDIHINQADEPALFFAGCQAFYEAQQGVPTGYMISLDATSSGLQLLAVLTGDRKAAELCNVVSVPMDFSPEAEAQRRDGYTVIYNEMLLRIGEEGKITRDDTKQAIMTSLYSSKAVPKMIFGEGQLLDTFYGTMSDMAPGAWELNEAMLGLWNSDALMHSWTLPDNFHVHVKVMDRVKEKVHFLNQPFDVFHKVNQPMEEGRSLGANTIHSIDGMIVREMTRRCDYNITKVNALYNLLADESVDPTDRVGTKTKDDQMVVILWDHYQRCGYLSARIIDHLNADNIGHVDVAIIHELLESLPNKPFKVLSIHDCFRCHPNYGNDLREQYARQLMLIAKSNMLDDMISQIVGRNVVVGKLDHDLWLDILDTEYALS